MTASGARIAACARASSPVAAVTTSYPARLEAGPQRPQDLRLVVDDEDTLSLLRSVFGPR